MDDDWDGPLGPLWVEYQREMRRNRRRKSWWVGLTCYCKGRVVHMFLVLHMKQQPRLLYLRAGQLPNRSEAMLHIWQSPAL